MVTEGQRYHLRSHVFRVDLDHFNARLRRARELEGARALAEYEQAIALYAGDFLERELYGWAEPWRAEYRLRFAAACREAGRLAAEGRDLERAAAIYGRLLASDPIDEEAARELMRCHALRRDPNGVRRVYRALEQGLRRELDDDGARPARETAELLRELTSAPGGG